MGNFKMKAPYNIDPTSVHEVPFDNPALLGKANKNGTIIINNSTRIAGNPNKRDEIVKHEKHHLKEMIVDKNADGSPKLDYDAESVSYKGVKYPRSEFDEGNKGLPWEKDAYGADKDIDFTGQLKSAPKMIGDKSGVSDEDEVSMGESFGPASHRGFMMKPRGQSNPFKYMEDKGLLGEGIREGIDGGPGVYEDPMQNMAETDEMLSGPAQVEEISENPGDQQTLDEKALNIANQNMQNSEWTIDPNNPEQEIRTGTGNATSAKNTITKDLPTARGGAQAKNPDEYINKLKTDYPNKSYQDLVDGGYVHKDNAKAKMWWEENTVKPEDLTSTQNVNEFRVKPEIPEIPDGNIPDGNIPDGNIPDNDTDTSMNKKRKSWSIGFNRKKKDKGDQPAGEYSHTFSTSCGKEGCIGPDGVEGMFTSGFTNKDRRQINKKERKLNRAGRQDRREEMSDIRQKKRRNKRNTPRKNTAYRQHGPGLKKRLRKIKSRITEST